MIWEPSPAEILRCSPSGLTATIQRPWNVVPTITSLSPSSGSQWETTATTVTVTGTGYLPSSAVYVGATAYATTYISSTQLSISIPGAITAASPMRTSGAKSLTVVNGAFTSNASSFTVNARSMAADGTGRKRLFVASSANCNGATNGTQFTPWTDSLGNGDLTQTTAGREPYYYDPESNGQPGVYCDSVTFGDITGTNPFGTQNYLCAMTVRFYIFNDADNHRTLATSGASLDLRNAASTTTLRWTGGAGTGSGYVESGSFTAGAFYKRVITLRRYNSGATFSMTIHDSSGLGTPVTLGTSGATFGAPGTIWLGCAGFGIDGSGSRYKRVYISDSDVTLAEEQWIAAEALVTDAIVA